MGGNPLDSVIGFFSPTTARDRMIARRQMQAAMNYDAATQGRRAYGWKAPATSADSAASATRARLRYLSRDFIRNRAIASRAQEVVTSNVVGTGIVPSVAGGGTKRDAKRAQEIIDRHFGTTAIDAQGVHDLAGLQAIVVNTIFSDGEVLVRRRMKSGRFAGQLVTPFRVELLEVDYLDQSLTSFGQNRVVEGVEYGPTGEAVAFHVYDAHPGDLSYWGRKALTSSRVPAAEMALIARRDRPGQFRGVPWLTPVMLHLGELSDYREAQILKQRMAALLAGVVTTTEDAAGPATALEPLGALEPGALVGLPPGQDIRWTDPPKVDGFSDFTADTDRQIAAGLGITYEALTGNLTGVNFSSGRMGRMEMDRNVERWQALVVAQFCRLVEKWTREAEGLVPDSVSGRGAWSLDWTPPRRALIDPTKEIPALRTAVDAGFLSRARVQRQLGVNPETVRAERADDLKKDKDAGLPPPPNDTGAAGAAPDPGPVVSPDDF